MLKTGHKHTCTKVAFRRVATPEAATDESSPIP